MVKFCRKLKFSVCLLFIFYIGHSFADQPIAFVDRTQIGENESLNLTIEVPNQGDSPDVSVLAKDFEILNQSNSSRINITNGRMESKNEWIYTLIPKSDGNLTIPPIVVGTDKTNAIKITVQKQKEATSTESLDLFLEVSVDTENPYVQSQIRYTVRLFQGISLREGSLTEPQIDNAIVERLGEGVTYNTEKNGRRYRVSERQYAIFPQSSGEFIIQPVVFNGEIANQNSRSRDLNFFGMDPFNRMFTPGKPVRIRSKQVQINVRPQAKEFKGNWWLPAKNLELQENWTSSKASYYVGEPITRTITLQGTGITSAQLPDLEVDEIVNASLYPDKATKESQLINGNLVANKQQKIAIIPSQPGKLTLPKIEIHWWDIVHNKARVAVLDEKTIDVLPAVGQAKMTQNTTRNSETGDPLPIKQNNMQVAETRIVTTQSPVMMFVSGFLLTAWIITLLLWRQQYKKTAKSMAIDTTQAQESRKEARRKFHSACDQNNAAMARDSLLLLCGILWPQEVIRNLKDLADKIDDATATKALSELDQALYSPESSSWNGSVFYQRLDPLLKTKRQKSKKLSPSLPGLYST